VPAVEAGDVEAVDAALDAGQGVVASVSAMIVGISAEPGTTAQAIGALALAQAQAVDEGDVVAAPQLRITLQLLAEAAGLAQEGEQRFTLFEIADSITREGVAPNSVLGRALLREDDDGRTWAPLVTFYPPPAYPNGWCGTAVHGSMADYVREHGQDAEYGQHFPEPGPLAFWPPLKCPRCGYLSVEDPPEAA
jgi:hypothetical protein